MKERPILFSAPMVRAILAGAKTQTRRVVKLPGTRSALTANSWVQSGPHGAPGDRLWVRETFYCDDYRYPAVPGAQLADPAWRDGNLYYRADVASGRFEDAGYWAEPGGKWTPSIHMPRWASRITLEIASVRVERITSISEEDARAEGVDWAAPHPYGERWSDDDREDPREVGYGSGSFARDNFRRLWDAINGKRPGCSWADDPWVWAIGFKRVEAL